MTRPFAWLYVRTRIPEDWELILYSLDETFGSVELATRAGIQARLHWRKARVGSSATPWEWSWDQGKDGIQAQCVIPEKRVKLSWTFPVADRVTAEQVVADTTPQPEEEEILSVQGIEATVPPRFKPVDLQAHPANVMLALEGPRQSRIVHRRWGLPSLVLQGLTPDAFFHRMLLTLSMRVERMESRRLLGRDAVEAEFTSRGLTPASRLLLLRARGRGWIWLDEETQRLQTLEFLGPRHVEFPPPEACVDVW